MGQHFLKTDDIRLFLPDLLQDEGLPEAEIVLAVRSAVIPDVECYEFHVVPPVDTDVFSLFVSAI